MNDLSPSSQELLNEIRNGSKEAFTKLYNSYSEVMYRAAFRRVKSDDLAQDIIQETFIEIWNRRKNLNIKTSIKIYLLTAVKYKVFRYIDKNRQMEDVNALETYPIIDESNILEFEELFELIEINLEKLPQNYRLIFQLNKFEGLTPGEIGKKMGMKTQSVRNALSRTSKFLKEELDGYCSIFF